MKNKEIAEFFGRDERTIRRWKSEGMPSHDANAAREWWLDNKHDQREPRGPSRPGDPLLDNFVDRRTGWREIHCRKTSTGLVDALGFDSTNATIDQIAKLFGWPPEKILTLVRLGAPYRESGNFETGEGFRLHFVHILEWSMLSLRAARAADSRYRWIESLF